MCDNTLVRFIFVVSVFFYRLLLLWWGRYVVKSPHSPHGGSIQDLSEDYEWCCFSFSLVIIFIDGLLMPSCYIRVPDMELLLYYVVHICLIMV